MLLSKISCIFLLLSSAFAHVVEESTMVPEMTTEDPVISSVRETETRQIERPSNNNTEFVISPSLYRKARSYIIKSSVFSNITKLELYDLILELETWKAPEFLRKSMPYYFAGTDYDGQPVWVAEFGKYDFERIFKDGPHAIPLLEKYSFQVAYRVIKSLHARDRPGKEVRQATGISDLDGLKLRFLAHAPAVEFCVRMISLHRDFLAEIIGSIVTINASYAAVLFVDIIRPVVGNIMERVDILGPNKSKWLPKLKARFPPEILPPWYGGREDFKPEESY